MVEDFYSGVFAKIMFESTFLDLRAIIKDKHYLTI